MAMTMPYVTRPSIGLGNPKAEACSLFMMLPHATTGLRLQPGVKEGSSSSLNLSIVMTQEASSPAAPVITRSRARPRPAPKVRLPPSSSWSDEGWWSTAAVVISPFHH